MEAIQDARMKAYFDHYPDLLMFDGTFGLNDRRMVLIILLVVDGNGESQIVGLFLVKSENAAIFKEVFQAFKADNPHRNLVITNGLEFGN